jgi:selenoprotein W-related protein
MQWPERKALGVEVVQFPLLRFRRSNHLMERDAVSDAKAPRVEIHYCLQCRWLLRAAWLAQELLSTFENDLGEVALVPGSGGVFDIVCNGNLLYSRKREGRFPEAKEIKQLVRDQVSPERDLGHTDRPRVGD